MPLFTVDSDKCKRDGVCVAECPVRIIELKDDGSVPRPIEGAGALCIDCGHCVAACPHGALSLKTQPVDACEPIRENLLPTAEAATHFMKSRRSVRTYRRKPVKKETLEKLIDIARYAPSGHNCQPVSWLVIHDPDEARRLAGFVIDWMRHIIETQPDMANSFHLDRVVAGWEDGRDPVLRGAPHVIVAHAPKNLPPAAPACTIALSHLELAAFAHGLGACWAGYFNTAANQWKPMLDALALPEGDAPFGAMMIGRPKFEYHRIPRRKPAKVVWR